MYSTLHLEDVCHAMPCTTNECGNMLEKQAYLAAKPGELVHPQLTNPALGQFCVGRISEKEGACVAVIH